METVANFGRPRPRAGHVAVRAGNYVLIWGGYDEPVCHFTSIKAIISSYNTCLFLKLKTARIRNFCSQNSYPWILKNSLTIFSPHQFN